MSIPMSWIRLGVVTLILCGLSLPLSAAPWLISDYVADARLTQCAVYLEGAPRAVSAVDKDAAGKVRCKHDLASVATGAHSVTAAFVAQDPVWGTQEGPKSVPFAFTRPAGLTAAPGGISLVP